MTERQFCAPGSGRTLDTGKAGERKVRLVPMAEESGAAACRCDPSSTAGADAGQGGDEASTVIPMAPAADFEAKLTIWRAFRAGAMSFEEARQRSAALDAAPMVPKGPGRRGRPPLARPRHARPAPNPSRQYANPIATTAMRDDRLTPGARALLVVLRARCGKGRTTRTCKTTLGAVMSRSARTIRRYLADLERFGYITLTIARNASGLHTGLLVTLGQAVLPFFAEPKGLQRWLDDSALAKPFAPLAHALAQAHPTAVPAPKPAFPAMSDLSSRNLTYKDSSLHPKFWLRKMSEPGLTRPD